MAIIWRNIHEVKGEKRMTVWYIIYAYANRELRKFSDNPRGEVVKEKRGGRYKLFVQNEA